MAIYFDDSEIVGLDSRLVEMLDAARGFAGVPFIITEGLASGGSHVENTAHQRGLAVDLHCPSSGRRMKIVAGLLKAGFVRIGCYDRHVHADIDLTLPQNVLWVGQSR